MPLEDSPAQGLVLVAVTARGVRRSSDHSGVRDILIRPKLAAVKIHVRALR